MSLCSVVSLFFTIEQTLGSWSFHVYTVTRPYAGFRHPDLMAPDQTVRGGENDCLIWSGNFLPQVAKFSSIFPKPGIFQRFTWSSVRGVPFLCWYFTFLDAGRHFRNFPEILPCEKIKERAQGGIELRILRMVILTSTSTPRLHYWRVTKFKILLSFIQLHVLVIRGWVNFH